MKRVLIVCLFLGFLSLAFAAECGDLVCEEGEECLLDCFEPSENDTSVSSDDAEYDAPGKVNVLNRQNEGIFSGTSLKVVLVVCFCFLVLGVVLFIYWKMKKGGGNVEGGDVESPVA